MTRQYHAPPPPEPKAQDTNDDTVVVDAPTPDVQELAGAINDRIDANANTGITLMQGKVISATNDGNKCNIQFAPPGSKPVTSVRVLIDAYYPVPNDTVWVAKNGSDIFVLGRTIDTGGRDQHYSRNFAPANMYSGDWITLDDNDWHTAPALDLGRAYPDFAELSSSGKIRVLRSGVWKLNITARFVDSTEEIGEMEPDYTDLGNIPDASFTSLPDALVVVQALQDWLHDYVRYMDRRRGIMGLAAVVGSGSPQLLQCVPLPANDELATLSGGLYFEANKGDLITPKVMCSAGGRYPYTAVVTDLVIQWAGAIQRADLMAYDANRVAESQIAPHKVVGGADKPNPISKPGKPGSKPHPKPPNKWHKPHKDPKDTLD